MFVIDNDLRIITPPKGAPVLGVEHDANVNRLQFSMPRMYGGFDLSTFEARVNYRNANKELDAYIVTDAAVNGDRVEFSWLVGRHALQYKGTVKFIVCLRRMTADGEILQEFNTTPAELPVLEGLEVELSYYEEETARDVIQQLLGLIDARGAEVTDAAVKAIEDKGAETLASIPEDYTALAEYVHDQLTAQTSDIDALAVNATQSQQAFDGANFDFDKLGTITGGFVTLRADTGNNTHQNYLYCRSDRRKVSRFFFKVFTGGVYTQIRPFIQDSAGHIYTFVILPATGKCSVYDESFAGVVGSASQISTGAIVEGTHTVDVVIVGTTVCIYIDGVYSHRIDLSALMSGDITRVGYNFRGYSDVNGMSAYKDGVVYHRERFAHISFDDQLECLQELVRNSRASVWDGTYFSVLKNFHDTYGCKFTLELFYQNKAENPTFDLSMVPTAYKNEFISASGWLKFAYHGPDPTTKPANDMTAAELTQSVSDVYAQIKRFAGQCCIDTTPRLSYFNATKEQVLELKSAGYITGLLTADDTREANSGLTAAELGIIQTHDVYTDYVNKITYFRSGTRFDSATAEIAVATLIADESSRQNDQIYIIFAHNYTEQDMQDKLSAIAAWCNGRGIMYDYPCNHLEYDNGLD